MQLVVDYPITLSLLISVYGMQPGPHYRRHVLYNHRRIRYTAPWFKEQGSLTIADNLERRSSNRHCTSYSIALKRTD